jgi:signal transduction histidine kinase
MNSGTGERNVHLEFDPPEDLVTIPLDPEQIEDAVLNLIINAIEAAEGDGTVTIRVTRSEDEQSEAVSSPGEFTSGEFGEEAIVEVSDDGRGISEEDLKRVFNPFFTTRPGGTGLGLPAVRRIARAHGGRVEVRSSPGKGSTFRIYLPMGQ